MTYPEKIPSNPKVDSFNFSFSRVSKNEKHIENELEQLYERINKIVGSDKFHINGIPVLHHIYSLNPNRSDLKKLSKACDRLSELIDLVSDLSSKMAVINVAKENPNWLAFAFGDFQQEIDNDIESLFSED